MSFAFGHLIGAWLLGKLFEVSSKKKLSHLTWFFLLLGGILPDMDFLVDWVFKTELHRTITHSLIFMVGAGLLICLVLSLLKIKDAKINALALSSGIFVHLILDMLFSNGVPLFWPSLLHFSFSGINYFDPSAPSFLHIPPEGLINIVKAMIFDMAIGTAWIFYLWFRRRIRF